MVSVVSAKQIVEIHKIKNTIILLKLTIKILLYNKYTLKRKKAFKNKGSD